MPKATTPRSTARRHNPLAEDILSSGHLRTTSTSQSGKRKSRTDNDEAAAAGDKFIDAKASRKILQIGQDLADEDEAERRAALGQGSEPVNKAFDFSSRFDDDAQISDDEDKLGEEQWADEDEVDDAVCFVLLEVV
jgi:essential nuclear protein 1